MQAKDHPKDDLNKRIKQRLMIMGIAVAGAMAFAFPDEEPFSTIRDFVFGKKEDEEEVDAAAIRSITRARALENSRKIVH